MKNSIFRQHIRILLLLLLSVCFFALPACTTADNREENSLSEKTSTDIPVFVGNYSYYVPEDSEINYDNVITTVNCSGYGIKSFCLSDAPETEDAVSRLYRTDNKITFTNRNNIEGLIVEFPYKENTIVKVFCFTSDNTFHSIEIWADINTSEKVADSIFDSVILTDVNNLIDKDLQKDAMNAANELDMYDSMNEPPTGAYF